MKNNYIHSLHTCITNNIYVLQLIPLHYAVYDRYNHIYRYNRNISRDYIIGYSRFVIILQEFLNYRFVIHNQLSARQKFRTQ